MSGPQTKPAPPLTSCQSSTPCVGASSNPYPGAGWGEQQCSADKKRSCGCRVCEGWAQRVASAVGRKARDECLKELRGALEATYERRAAALKRRATAQRRTRKTQVTRNGHVSWGSAAHAPVHAWGGVRCLACSPRRTWHGKESAQAVRTLTSNRHCAAAEWRARGPHSTVACKHWTVPCICQASPTMRPDIPVRSRGSPTFISAALARAQLEKAGTPA